MRAAHLQSFAISALAAASALLLNSCQTTTTASHRALPAYEPPIARSDFQTVRTTAYTHSEADHLQYGATNALGGHLQSASIPKGRVDAIRRALPVTDVDDSNFRTIAFTSAVKKRSSGEKGSSNKTKAARSAKPKPPQIGSAAADWSRWPAGTMFRVASTGQLYRVDDYGWALAGRNTIDLYMSSPAEMNSWGVRHEPIQIIRWGDSQQSLQVLQSRQGYKHCRRMVLEMQGQDLDAAALN